MYTVNWKARVAVVSALLAPALMIGSGTGASATGPMVTFRTFIRTFDSPIGIDFYEPAGGLTEGQLIVSGHYPIGGSSTFELIDASGAATSLVPNDPGLPDEVKVATVRAGQCQGGFSVGDVFYGNGHPGGIGRISNGVTTNAWVSLPGVTDGIRGSLYQDRNCAFGGDLIVITANEQPRPSEGTVWRIPFDAATNLAHPPELLLSTGRHLEGLTTLPNDPTRYGPLAGRILAGDEDLCVPGSCGVYNGPGRVWAIKSASDIIVVGEPIAGYTTACNPTLGPVTNCYYPTSMPIHPEDFDLVPAPRPGLSSPEGDLFIVDYASSRILAGAAAGFADRCGDIVITQEFPVPGNSGLTLLHWNAVSGAVETTVLLDGPVDGEAVGHFEHASFWGGRDCPASLSGYVYVDANNDGVKDPGESPIAGVAVSLTGITGDGTPLTRSTTTDAAGWYAFTDLVAGTYTVTESQPVGYLDGKDTQGTPGTGTTGNDVFTSIALASGVNGTDNNFGELQSASISGFVYVDADDDGVKDVGEFPISAVPVALTGTNVYGASVSLSTTTNGTGFYSFSGLVPGTYTVTESQPVGYLDGKDTQGTPGTGTTGNDVFTSIALASGVNGTDNNFGEIVRAVVFVSVGDTATIGYWQNKNGQALIKAMNGGSGATQLATWLATNFPYLYGASSSNNLTGKTNADVARLFVTFFKRTGPKTDAQVMAGALASYVTNSTLAGGTYAAAKGFNVSTTGTGAKSYNVGAYGSAIGLANYTSYTVVQLLQQANLRRQQGTFNANAFNAIFDGINRAGDIV